MRIIHVIDSIAKQASGPTYSVVALCAALAERGHEVELHVLAPAPDLGHRGFRLFAHPRAGFPSRIGRSPAARRALSLAARSADIMHSHGLWRMPHVYAAQASVGTRCCLVTSPRGALAPWARQWHAWRKRVLWWTLQRRALHRARLIHVTALQEQADVRAAGLSAPTALIPNGIDVPETLPTLGGRVGPRRVLFLGRIHPIKGLDRLIEAWRRGQDAFPGWELRIVGVNEDGYAERVAEQARAIGALGVVIGVPVYGAEKQALILGSDLLILPSHTENFGLAVAEALAHGVPAIATRGTPWDGLVSHGCGWWVDGSVDGLAGGLRDARALTPDQLALMGARGRAWMAGEFSWDRVAEQMEASYRWAVQGGDRPPWISTGPA